MSVINTTLPTAPVSSVCDQLRGVSYSKSDAHDHPQDDLVPILRANNILESAELLFDDLVYVPPRCVSSAQYILQYDVVVAASSGSISVVGKAAQALHDWHGSFGAFCKVLRPNHSVDPRYFAYFFRTSYYRHRISQLAAGANINNLRNEHLNDLEIPLPPLSEQKRIADILDKADAILRKRQEAVEHYDALLDAAFAHTVGVGATNHEDWNSITLGEIADFVGGSSLPEGETFKGQKHGLLLVKVGDMNLPGNEIAIKTAREWYGSTPNGFALCPQDGIVIPKRGGAIGTNKKRLLSRDALLDPNLMGIVPKNHTHAAWLFQWFQQFDLLRLVSGSTVPQLNKKDLSPLILQLPPSECLSAFAASSARIRASQEVAIQAAQESEDLFNSLVQRAFKGDL